MYSGVSCNEVQFCVVLFSFLCCCFNSASLDASLPPTPCTAQEHRVTLSLSLSLFHSFIFDLSLPLFSLCPSVSRSTFASSRSFSLPNSPSGLVPSLLHECLVSHGVLLVVTLPYSRTHTHSAWANRHAFSGKLPLFPSLLFLFPLSLLSSLQSSNTVLIQS